MAGIPKNLITLYGRNPVLEALLDPAVTPWRLHLSDRNRPAEVLQRITDAARQRGIDTVRHSPEKLSRISRNGRQDQGVALDVVASGYQSADSLLAQPPERCRLLAIDRVQNPQNLGMIIRSSVAGFMDGILLPKDGTSGLNPLCIKASAGTAFRASIFQCSALQEVLAALKAAGFCIYTLHADARQDVFALAIPPRCIFVLGNENEGVQASIDALADARVAIPMRRNTESLNVAATASILSFLPGLRA